MLIQLTLMGYIQVEDGILKIAQQGNGIKTFGILIYMGITV